MAHGPLEGGLQLCESRKREGGTRKRLVSAFLPPPPLARPTLLFNYCIYRTEESWMLRHSGKSDWSHQREEAMVALVFV